MNFSNVQATFGFRAADIEIAKLRISLITESGNKTHFDLNNRLPQWSGGMAFFRVIYKNFPFSAVEFSRVSKVGDGFGDDLTKGRLERALPEPP